MNLIFIWIILRHFCTHFPMTWKWRAIVWFMLFCIFKKLYYHKSLMFYKRKVLRKDLVVFPVYFVSFVLSPPNVFTIILCSLFNEHFLHGRVTHYWLQSTLNNYIPENLILKTHFLGAGGEFDVWSLFCYIRMFLLYLFCYWLGWTSVLSVRSYWLF